MSDALTYGGLNKIYRLLRSKFDIDDQIHLRTVHATIKYTDINTSRIYPVHLASLPEKSVWLNSVVQIITPFTGPANLSFSLGIESKEYEGDINYGKIFNEYQLLNLSVGQKYPNISYTSNNLLNLHPSRLVATYYVGGVWTAKSALNTARDYFAAAGSQYFSLAIGGFTTVKLDNCELYTEGDDDWDVGGTMNAAIRNHMAAGSSASAFSTGGTGSTTYETATEEYNGTAWSAGGTLNVGRIHGSSTGASVTSGLSFGGQNSDGTAGDTESYDGTTWTVESDMNVFRAYCAGFGVQNASVAHCGYDVTRVVYLDSCEEFNGVTWTTVNPSNTEKWGNGGSGTITDGLSFGGWDGSNNLSMTEEYDGTAWSYSGSLLAARRRIKGAGAQKYTIAFGGNSSTYSTATEGYNPGSLTNLSAGEMEIFTTFSYQ